MGTANVIRLSCEAGCDAALEDTTIKDAKAAGWRDIHKAGNGCLKSDEESDIFWYTHTGLCPHCAKTTPPMFA